MATVSTIQGNALKTETTQPSTGILQTVKDKWNHRKVEILVAGASTIGGAAALAVALAVGSILWPVALAVSALGLAALIRVAFFAKQAAQLKLQEKQAPELPETVSTSFEVPASETESLTSSAPPVVKEAPLALSYSDYLLAATNGVQLAGLMGGVTAPVVIGAGIASGVAQYMMLPADATKLQKATVALPVLSAPVLGAYPMVGGALQTLGLYNLAKHSGAKVAGALSEMRKSPLNALKVGGVHMFNLLSGAVLTGTTLVRGYKSISSSSEPVKGAAPKINGTNTCDPSEAPVPVNGTQVVTPKGIPLPTQFISKDTCPIVEIEPSTALVAQNTPFMVKGQWMVNIPGRGTLPVTNAKFTPAELEVIAQLESRQTNGTSPRAIGAPSAANSADAEKVIHLAPAGKLVFPNALETPKLFVKGLDDTTPAERAECAQPESGSFVERQLAPYKECLCLRTAWHNRNERKYDSQLEGMASKEVEEILDFVNPVECPDSLIPGPRRK